MLTDLEREQLFLLTFGREIVTRESPASIS